MNVLVCSRVCVFACTPVFNLHTRQLRRRCLPLRASCSSALPTPKRQGATCTFRFENCKGKIECTCFMKLQFCFIGFLIIENLVERSDDICSLVNHACSLSTSLSANFLFRNHLHRFMLGYAITAIGGQMTLFAVFPTAFELAEFQTLVFATNSCFFDGSCVVFQVSANALMCF